MYTVIYTVGKNQSRRVRGIRLIDQHKAGSLDLFRDGYFGKIHKIWSKLPLEPTVKGQTYGWRSIVKKAKGFQQGNGCRLKHKQTKQKKVQIGSEIL